MSTSNFNNPLGGGNFNPLGGGGVTINQKTIGNQKNVAMPQVEEVKLEEQMPLPTEFKNAYIERLCQSEWLTDELNKFETNQIKMRNKSIQIINLLNQDKIDKHKLNLLTFSGVPEAFNPLRTVVWRLLMDGLPYETSQWETTIAQNHETYENFKKELIVNPKLKDE